MSSLPVAILYPICLLSIPFIATSSVLNGVILPRLSFELNLHYIRSDPIIVTIAAITLYCYCILGAVSEIIKLFTERDFRMQESEQELTKFYPPFVVSAAIMFANTNQLDNLRTSLVLLQAIAYLVYPLAALKEETKETCKMFFKCALVWSIIYAISPVTVIVFIKATNYYVNTWLSNRNQQVYYVF